jgi:purine-binding chemotaxis protein CheW
MNGAAPANEGTELLVFELAGVRYGIELTRVREVLRAVFITPLPDAPAVVEGIIEVRGEVVPVYDLRLRFGLPPRRLDPDEHIIVAWTGERRVALRCDRADWIERITPDMLRDAGAVALRGRQVAGVASLDGGLVLIHDPEAFLDEAERTALDEALAGRSDA